MSGILFPSGIAMNTLDVRGIHDDGGAQGSVKGAQMAMTAMTATTTTTTTTVKRKEREEDGQGAVQGGVKVAVAPTPESGTSTAPSSKRPKPCKSSSTNPNNSIITGTHIKLDLQKKTLVLVQDPQPLDKYTSYLSLMARFQEWFMEQPLEHEVAEIPKEYYPLVAMIGHEYSGSQKGRLVEYIALALKPTDVSEGQVARLSTSCLTQTCTDLFTQQSYGFHPADFSHLVPDSATCVKVAASLALKRWEVRDWGMIPQSGVAGRGFKARDVMIERRRSRELAREEVRKIAGELDAEVARCLLGLGGEKASGSKIDNGEIKTENRITILQAKPSKPKPPKAEKPKIQLTPEQIVEKEAKEADKRARDAERLRRVEAKAKKEQEVAKSKAMMMGFFKKPVGGAVSPVKTQEARPQSRSESLEVECLVSDFQSSFKPFYAKGNVEVAPINGFALNSAAHVESEDVSSWPSRDILSNILVHASRASSFPPIRPPLARNRSTPEASRPGLVRTPKTAPLFCTIPDLVDRAQEAEDPRRVYAHLRDPTKFPRKVFKFDEDLRPPYHGTWTKASWFVGPRTPFALDLNVDYAIDEGLDWEPENLDEGAMDVDEDEEPEESEDDDDEMGSWLASDDELDGEPDRAMDDPFGGGDPLGMPVVKPKTSKESKLPQRKFEKLVQFQKGPVWENGLGEVAWKGFEQYRICVLNDTPLGGIDPFTWQAPPDVKPTQPADKAPAVSATPQPTVSTPTGPAKPSTSSSATPKPIVPRAIPKANLTPTQLVDFLRIVEGSDKVKRALVVELSTRFPSAGTQNSIKAKLEDVATKANTKGSLWVVKPAAWAEAQVDAPTSGA